MESYLIPKLLNNSFASFSFKNLDFLLLHTVHFVFLIPLDQTL